MRNADYYLERPSELADKLDEIIDGQPRHSGKTCGDLIAAFLNAECKEAVPASGETTFIVTLDVSNTIKGDIDDMGKTADALERLYLDRAAAALTDIFGDARDADNVSVRYTKIYPGGDYE